MNAPVILRSIPELKAWRSSQEGRSVGFVPTMGALHAGHADLLARMRPRVERSVLSLFVNPTQFGPNEDLSRYPRTFESDLGIAARHGVHAVFFPTPEQMYPEDYSTYVEEGALTRRLCGEFRPGHFRGVTTVVLKLFNLVRPEVAYFGLKDAQQFFVLHKMARDLDLPVSVEGIPTVREADGLALSSRNVYLSAEERAVAPALYRSLRAAAAAIEGGSAAPEILARERESLESRGFRVQYLECLSLPRLEPLQGPTLTAREPAIVAVAAMLGTTRLIDNVLIRAGRLAEKGIRAHL